MTPTQVAGALLAIVFISSVRIKRIPRFMKVTNVLYTFASLVDRFVTSLVVSRLTRYQKKH